MSNQDRLLLNKLTAEIKLAVALALDKIKNSQDPIVAIAKNGKHIKFLNLKEQLIK